ncbi:MAG: putative transposase [Moorella sp. (in: firmicutes)]|jgi:transposase InsO family protein|nr:putative transposase [Moorella sp. (in: firmicutes)]
MDEKLRNEMALFRFSLIAPLVNGTVSGSVKDYLESVCARSYQVPGGGTRELSPNTVRRWLSDYRRFGLEGLKRKPRSDKGLSRTLAEPVIQAIKEMKARYPDKTATAIYNTLLARGALGDPPVSLSTFQRYFKNLEVKVDTLVERKRFAFEFANDCWQTDVLVGPYLVLEGKKKKTFLIAFLDDASRLLLHGEFFLAENAQNLQSVLKKAILKRGIPKRIFSDNGKIFDSLQLRLTCAHLGIILSHARPYSPASKGKIERAFRTIRMQFIASLDLGEVHSLEELNAAFLAYAESTYNLRPHASLQGLSPMERYLEDKDKLRFVASPESLEQVFLHEVTRKVKKDATIALNKQVYEVPQALIGRSITVRYDPDDPSKAFVKVGEPPSLVTVYQVRPVDNARIIRRQNAPPQIDYAALYGGGDGQ